jgi:putative N-acetyltransferase (TIGR04045 family)
MVCLDDVLESPPAWAPVEFLVHEATQGWERDGAYALRRAVFCIEQGLFGGAGSVEGDRDTIDGHAQLLVAMSCSAGMPEQVVGTVRIHEKTPGTWWGSRLAVHRSFRNQGNLGATLIRLAVGRAHAQGCHTFMAHVQAQNVPLFRKLNWTPVADMLLHGRPHCEMRADLRAYPPCHDAASGFVTRGRTP